MDSIFKNIGFAVNNSWALTGQLITIIPLVWFSYKILKNFKDEIINEHNQQGAIPILAVIYTIISGCYCYNFIINFDSIIITNQSKILDVLNVLDDSIFYMRAINLLTISALTAFTFNFIKSLYTLNSLEFGMLNNKALKEIFGYNKNKAIFEGFLRLIIAIIFIYIEKKLGKTSLEILKPINSDALDFEDSNFFFSLGIWISSLYSSLFLWLIVLNKYLDTKKSISKKWYRLSFYQFGCGLIIGLIFCFIGSPYTEKFKYILSSILIFGVITSFFLIGLIIRNEWLNYKYGSIQYIPQ